MAIVNSISGTRATLEEFTPKFIEKYAAAFNSFIPSGTIIIGRDGRPSGVEIEKVLIDTFVKLGRKIEIIGVVPTPTVQLMVEHTDAVGGIIITASHNPENWNGLKFLNSKGVFLDAEENKKFWSYLDIPINYVDIKAKELLVSYNKNALDFHINRLLSVDFIKNNIDFIREKKYTVVVDAVNASGSFIVCNLLERLNCNVVRLYCDGTGVFPHTPEPLPVNLTDLANAVSENNADLGVAVDPDADRLVLVDNKGNNVWEEHTICIAVNSVLELLGNKNINIAVNQSTTQLVDYIANLYSANVSRSAVGEINVVKKMQETNSVIGGEGSGGVILPYCHYGRDSLVGILLVLALISRKNITLSELIDTYPVYQMIKKKHPLNKDFNDIRQYLLKYYEGENISLIDGIKINFKDNSWVHIRSSNTEPIIRVIAEAKQNEASIIIDNVTKVLKSENYI